LQEFDHIPVVAPVTRRATTVVDTNTIPDEVHTAVVAALTPPRGPVFVDFPLDVVFGTGSANVPYVPDGAPRCLPGVEPDPGDVARAAELLATAERPAMIVGSDVYWAGAWDELRAAAAALDIPVFANGLGRGLLAADDELSFSRARGSLRSAADVVAVLGTPLDFRLGFGHFGDAAVIHAVDHPDKRAAHADVAVSVAGDLAMFLSALADWSGNRSDHRAWFSELRVIEDAARAADDKLLAAGTEPIKPSRIYGELRRVLDRDAIVCCDGGDFVSYAGRFVDVHQHGTWLDTGPFGCLGTGLGYSMAARLAHPDRQVVCLLGDGAAGFSLMDVDTLVRHRLPVVFVCGNNGIWGLEKHPMQALYGYDVAAELQPGCRYDEVVTALGGAGETVTSPRKIGPALRRAFDSGVPYLVNVLTDPADVYPRSSNLG
jgi:acetolactate synthase-1/2/3 large subunit